MKHLEKIRIALLFVVFLSLLSSCTKEEPIVLVLPTADFEFEVSSDNNGTVTFNNTTMQADTYAWDFGDGVGTSNEKSPTYIFAETGNYTVSLVATNSDGQNAINKDVSVTVAVEAVELIEGGDMTDESKWTYRQVWTNDDNAVDHGFGDEAFTWDNSDGTAYSQAYLWQKVKIEADKEYKFSASVSSASGTKDIWFEMYFGNADPASEDDYGSNGLRLYISSFDDVESGCANDAFDDDFVTVAQGCTPSDDKTKILSADGIFTLSADELTSDGSVYVVFKSGSWDSSENYKDGITLDNVSIIEL